jgi:hypothetical protein
MPNFLQILLLKHRETFPIQASARKRARIHSGIGRRSLGFHQAFALPKV